jgi:hypothetical protein
VENPAFIQPVAVAFIAAIALAWTATLAYRLSRAAASGEWLLFAAFSGLLGASAFVGVFYNAGIGGVARWLNLFLASASYLALIEFGRRQVSYRSNKRLRPWVYLPLAGIAALLAAVRGLAGIDLAIRFVLAGAAGAFATSSFAQRARTSGRWEPALAAAAVAFLAVGYAFSVGPLVAFSSVGMLIAVWAESRRQLPFEAGAGAVKRWRAPAAFLVLTIAGTTVLALREPGLEQSSYALYVADGAGGAAAADDTLESVALDPRQLARDHGSAQRSKQGVILLAVIVVLAGVWGGLAYWSNRRA